MSGVFTTASLVFIESLLHMLLYIMSNSNSLIECSATGGILYPGARTYSGKRKNKRTNKSFCATVRF